MKTCLLCPNTRTLARGLCSRCYQKARALGMLAAFPKCQRPATSPRTAYWRAYYWRTVDRRREIMRGVMRRRRKAA